VPAPPPAPDEPLDDAPLDDEPADGSPDEPLPELVPAMQRTLPLPAALHAVEQLAFGDDDRLWLRTATGQLAAAPLLGLPAPVAARTPVQSLLFGGPTWWRSQGALRDGSDQPVPLAGPWLAPLGAAVACGPGELLVRADDVTASRLLRGPRRPQAALAVVQQVAPAASELACTTDGRSIAWREGGRLMRRGADGGVHQGPDGLTAGPLGADDAWWAIGSGGLLWVPRKGAPVTVRRSARPPLVATADGAWLLVADPPSTPLLYHHLGAVGRPRGLPADVEHLDLRTVAGDLVITWVADGTLHWLQLQAPLDD
jgi:hypothetical protein